MNNEWKMVRLGDVGKIVTGSTPKTSDANNYNAEDICFFKPSDLKDNINILSESEYKVSFSALNSARELPENSILVSCIGIIGKIGILTKKSISNQQINAIIPNSNYNSKFIAYSILHNRQKLQNIANAPVVPIINKSTFSNFRISTPSLKHQQEIAQILDKASELIEKRKEQLRELDSLAESVFYDMFGDPVTNSKEWKKKQLGELGKWQSGGTPSRKNSEYFKGNIPWVTSGELNDMFIYTSNEFISKDAVDNSNAKLIPRGALLLGMYDSAALKSSICSTGITCNQAIAYSILYKSLCDVVYVYYIIQINKATYKKGQRGIRQKNLNLSMIKGIEIIFPPLPLQHQFASIIEKIEAQKAKVKEALKESEALFLRLMQDLFNPEYHEK